MLKRVGLLAVLVLVLLAGTVIVAQPAADGSVAWDAVGPAWGSICPPDTVLHCGPCRGGYMWCCLYRWMLRGVLRHRCELYPFHCWINGCDDPIGPMALEKQPV